MRYHSRVNKPRPIRSESPEVPHLQDRALENLRFIRATMEQAAPFTVISGSGMASVGAVALLIAPLAHAMRSPAAWVAAWLGTAVVSLAIITGASVRKAQRTDRALLGGAERKFLLAVMPAMMVGLVLSIALLARGYPELLPAIWMLLYGTAVMAGGAFSVPPIPVMGAVFVLFGVLALALPDRKSVV